MKNVPEKCLKKNANHVVLHFKRIIKRQLAKTNVQTKCRNQQHQHQKKLEDKEISDYISKIY